MRKQKQAVVEEIKNVLGDSFVEFETVVKDIITNEQRKAAKENIVKGIINGTIQYNKDRSDEAAVRKYGSNLVNNYLRKAKELNGNVVNKSKKREDTTIKNLKNLIIKYEYSEGSEEYAAVQKAIAERQAELDSNKKVNKPKAEATVTQDLGLPSDLSELL